VNAFTFGGGMVVVFDGLFGGMVAPNDDDELAAVLAHEIAHVTLLHVPTRQTWAGFGSLAVKKTQDAYYRAAYSTEQEAEADRIAALYVALAGFDPFAAPRVRGRAHQRSGSSAAQYAFLHDHPLNAERYGRHGQCRHPLRPTPGVYGASLTRV
jgi:predicted Zn-dependent protease